MITPFSGTVDCENELELNTHYANIPSASERRELCLLDIKKQTAGCVYFGVACANIVFTVATSAAFIYYARKSNPYYDPALIKPNVASAERQQMLSTQWKQNSLQKRSIFGTTASGVGHLVFSTAVLMSQAFYSPLSCPVVLWGSLIGFYTWTLAFCWRAYRLYFLVQLNKFKTYYMYMQTNANAEQTAYQMSEKDYLWFIRNKDAHALNVVRPLSVYVTGLALIVLAIVMTEIYAFDNRRHPCQSRTSIYVLLAFVLLFFFIVAPYLIWIVRSLKDAHGIRNELLVDLAIGFPLLAMMIFWITELGKLIPSPTGPYYTHFFSPANWAVIFTFVAHTTSTVIPLIGFARQGKHCLLQTREKAHQHLCHLSHPSSLSLSAVSSAQHYTNNPESLDLALADPIMANLLLDYAIEDFSSENILFYQSYLTLVAKVKRQEARFSHQKSHPWFHDIVPSSLHEKFHPRVTPVQPMDEHDRDDDAILHVPIRPELFQDFCDFYMTYISEGAPLQVNISYRARVELDAYFSSCHFDTSYTGCFFLPWKRPHMLTASCRHTTHSPCPAMTQALQNTELSNTLTHPSSTHAKLHVPLRGRRSLPDTSASGCCCPVLTLRMLEAARREVFWNIFAGVYPKALEDASFSQTKKGKETCTLAP